MIYYQGRIRIQEPEELFRKYEVTKKDLAEFNRMIKAGKEDDAIDLFIEKYMVDPLELYNAVMIGHMDTASQGELKKEDESHIVRNVVVMSLLMSSQINRNYETFIKGPYRQVADVEPKKLQDQILNETLEQFKQLTEGALSLTRANVLNSIRTLQTEMIMENQRIRNLKFVGPTLDAEIKSFNASLKNKFPGIFEQIESGDVIFSRPLANGGFRRYKLTDYQQMATQTTLLNVDRKSVEVVNRVAGNSVVEYYLRDTRKLKTEPREICIHILSNKTFGRSLLAMDSETAGQLGIITIDSAREQGAMGVNCRHSIRSVAPALLGNIKKAMEAA